MKNKVLIEISARHIHVSRADLDKLYGVGHQLTKKKDLSQPGEFACEEKLTVVGPKGEISCSILGPERKQTQVEVSLTEARKLGVPAAIRQSGDLAGSSAIKLRGPAGEVELPEGLIAAKRHIHILPDEAAEYGLTDGQIVSVKVEGERALSFGETVVRVSPKYALAMHIDTDEANAAAISGAVTGFIEA